MTNKIISSRAITDLHSDFFKKSHRLVFSQLALSPVEHDMFALFLTKLHKEHWQDFINDEEIKYVPKYEFTTDVLCHWFGVSGKQLYATLKKPARRLAGKNIGIQNDVEKKFRFVPLFSDIDYSDGTLTIMPNHVLLHEYLCISQGHSQIPHNTFREIELEHAKRLYTMLCRFKDGDFELHAQSLSELHAFFGLMNEEGKLIKKSYCVLGNFTSRIIKPAIKEISVKEPNIQFHMEEGSRNFGFSYVKSGRKVTGIKFLFKWKQEDKTVDPAGELTIDDAIKTCLDLFNNTYLPSQAELNNLKLHMGELVVVGHEALKGFDMMGPEFIARFREAEEAAVS